MKLINLLFLSFIFLSINVFGKTDGTTGLPLGGIGTGAMKFSANTGTFAYSFQAPTRQGDYKSMTGAKFQLFTQRGTTVLTDDLLTGVKTDGRVDDDAIFPLHRVNFGTTNNVSVEMTMYMPFDQKSVDNMTHPTVLCEFTLTNLEATEVTVAPAFQIKSTATPTAVSGSGIFSAGTAQELCLLANITDGSGSISYGSDAGYLSSGAFNNAISGTTNSVAAKVTLAANATKTVRFVLSWYRPDDTDHYYYTNLWNNAKEVSVSALAKFDTFKANAEEFLSLMRASNLPEWLVDQTLNTTATLVNNSVYFKDGRYCHSEGQWEPEGTMDQMWHARQIFTMINPELAWMELEWWARTQHVTNYAGQIHHDFGIDYNHVGWDDTEHTDYRAIDKWVDLNCGFVLSVYETFNATGDMDKLNYFWPYVKKAAQRILDQVDLYGSTEYPYTFEDSESTYDAGGNSQAYNTGLSIVAYQMMIELAEIKSESDVVTKYSTPLATAVTNFEARWLDNSFALGSFCESAMVNLWIANFMKIDPFWDKAKLDNLFINMLVYYDPVNQGMGLPGGSYSEWEPYLVSHLGGYALQTGRSDVWKALQKDMYERNFLDRNLVFNMELGIPKKVTTPIYIATSLKGNYEYISIPVLWRSYYDMAGYHYNKYTKELWLEPKLFDEITELDKVTVVTPDGYATISYEESGANNQNQKITFTPSASMTVNTIYVSDKYTDGASSITKLQIGGTDMAYERTGNGDLTHLKMVYAAGSISTSGIVIDVEGVGKAVSGAVPVAPTEIIATATSASEVDLSWSAVSEDILGYIIDKKIDGKFQTLKILDSDVTSYSEIGLQEASEHTYRLRCYNVSGISEATAEKTVTTLSAEEGEIVLAYNIGSTYTAKDGTEYLTMPAAYVTGGREYSASSATISGTEDDVLYQVELFGNYSINIPLEAGKYNVILKMAEIYHSSPNSRLFHVDVEGARAIENLDIFAQVGKNVAYDVIIPVQMTDGTLNVQLTTVTDNAKINAIAIEKITSNGIRSHHLSENEGNFVLGQSSPNPASMLASITYNLKEGGDVKLSLFDMNGKEVADIVNQKQTAGNYQVTVDTNNLSNGLYYYRLDVNGLYKTKKMTVVK